MYVCSYGQQFQQSMDQPGMVVNPALCQLNRENELFPCLCSRMRILVSRDRFGRPVSRQPESGAFLRDSSRFPRRRPHIPSTATGSVPSLSGHAIAYRWPSLPRVRWHRPSCPQGSSSNGCYLLRFQDMCDTESIGGLCTHPRATLDRRWWSWSRSR